MTYFVRLAATLKSFSTVLLAAAMVLANPPASEASGQVIYGHTDVKGSKIAYREAGDPSNPALVLLHGFPSSSHMYRDLIPALARDYYVLAPDFPGSGASSLPQSVDFGFHEIAAAIETLLDSKDIERTSLYAMGYGVSVAMHLYQARPDRVEALVLQNGALYDDQLGDYWQPLRVYWSDPTPWNRDQLLPLFSLNSTKWQFCHGVQNAERISPDMFWQAQYLLDQPGVQAFQLQLFRDFGRITEQMFPVWQAMLRRDQPATLVIWGANDRVLAQGAAAAFRRDLPLAEVRLFETGRFVLEEFGPEIATEVAEFLSRSRTVAAPASVRAMPSAAYSLRPKSRPVRGPQQQATVKTGPGSRRVIWIEAGTDAL